MTTQARDATVSEMVRQRHRRHRARVVTLLAAIVVVTATGLGVGIVQANTTAPRHATTASLPP